jgi:hypothetical protein
MNRLSSSISWHLPDKGDFVITILYEEESLHVCQTSFKEREKIVPCNAVVEIVSLQGRMLKYPALAMFSEERQLILTPVQVLMKL